LDYQSGGCHPGGHRHIDIRIDQVIISPAPGTPARYEPFVLDPTLVSYDSTAMAPVGCLPNDMNEDERMDLLVYYWGWSYLFCYFRPYNAHTANQDLGSPHTNRIGSG
jgi:hypothetical protein